MPVSFFELLNFSVWFVFGVFFFLLLLPRSVWSRHLLDWGEWRAWFSEHLDCRCHSVTNLTTAATSPTVVQTILTAVFIPTHKSKQRFNGHFSDKPKLVSCTLIFSHPLVPKENLWGITGAGFMGWMPFQPTVSRYRKKQLQVLCIFIWKYEL